MRDEWPTVAALRGGSRTNALGVGDSRSSQGLTQVGRRNESGLDRASSLNLAARAMKLKLKTKGLEGQQKQREVSERRQVGDAESVVNPMMPTRGVSKDDTPWWKNVTMEEGM